MLILGTLAVGYGIFTIYRARADKLPQDPLHELLRLPRSTQQFWGIAAGTASLIAGLALVLFALWLSLKGTNSIA